MKEVSSGYLLILNSRKKLHFLLRFKRKTRHKSVSTFFYRFMQMVFFKVVNYMEHSIYTEITMVIIAVHICALINKIKFNKI